MKAGKAKHLIESHHNEVPEGTWCVRLKVLGLPFTKKAGRK